MDPHAGVLFCERGWVVVESPVGRRRELDRWKWFVRSVDPRGEGTEWLWQEQLVAVTPHLVVCTIGSFTENWYDPYRATVLAHARFFAKEQQALRFAAEHPVDQQNFVIRIGKRSSVRRPDPLLLLGDISVLGRILVLDVYLDGWVKTELHWVDSEEEALQSVHWLPDLTSGCLLKCCFRVSEGEKITPLIAAWLYATGPTDRMRWAIHPWPTSLPPPHVES